MCTCTTGISSAGLYMISVHALLLAKVDDPCLVVSSSLVGGIWGTLCAGFMPKDDYLPFGGYPNGGVTSFALERGEQFGVQVSIHSLCMCAIEGKHPYICVIFKMNKPIDTWHPCLYMHIQSALTKRGVNCHQLITPPITSMLLHVTLPQWSVCSCYDLLFLGGSLPWH